MGKRKRRATSPAETEILRIIWHLKQATIQQIYDDLPPDRKIVYKTVLTLVRRLEKKGYVKHKSKGKGKANVYSAKVKREEVVRRTVYDFLDRLFAGEAGPLVQFLAEDGLLGPEEARRLKEIIDNA